jgi:nucleotide-binding universal stress UspA family protein
MQTHVLIPVDDSPLARKALEVAFTDYPDAQFTALHVLDPIGSGFTILDVMRPKFDDGAPPGSVTPEYWEEWYGEATHAAESVFESAREAAAEHEVTLETEMAFGDPQSVIVDYARANAVDRVVMGSHSRSGAARLFLGSVAETVVRRSPVPVLVVR